jgi:hypothetical protein
VLSYNPDDRVSHLLRGGSLKSSIVLSGSCLTVSLDVTYRQGYRQRRSVPTDASISVTNLHTVIFGTVQKLVISSTILTL